jgi:hypothetical protein
MSANTINKTTSEIYLERLKTQIESGEEYQPPPEETVFGRFADFFRKPWQRGRDRRRDLNVLHRRLEEYNKRLRFAHGNDLPTGALYQHRTDTILAIANREMSRPERQRHSKTVVISLGEFRHAKPKQKQIGFLIDWRVMQGRPIPYDDNQMPGRVIVEESVFKDTEFESEEIAPKLQFTERGWRVYIFAAGEDLTIRRENSAVKFWRGARREWSEFPDHCSFGDEIRLRATRSGKGLHIFNRDSYKW